MTSESIPRTGFLVSVASYALFWLADAIRPGFVARYISVHLFLLAALLFGAWWLVVAKEWRERALLVYGAGVLLGLLCAKLAWDFGAGFDEYRILVVVLAACTPTAALSLFRHAR